MLRFEKHFFKEDSIMKNLLILAAITFSTSALADTASTTIGLFKGKMTIESERMDVKNIEVEVVHQYCNFWGTTCAGGPSSQEKLALITSESDDGKTISFAHESTSEMSSLKFGNRFSSCKVNLIVDAISADGRSIRGEKSLAWINDKEVCKSKEELTQTVRKSLAQTLAVKDGGIFVSIK